MRWLRLLLLIAGWLLTPLVVWAASHSGGWLGALAAGMVRNPDHAIWLPVIFAALFGITVTLLWMRLLRRSPRLRHSLHVSGEGIPHTAELIHELKGEESPPEEDGVAGTQAGSPGA